MSRILSLRFLLAALCISLLAGCASVEQDKVTQVSTIDALLVGVYEGAMPLSELREYGDFGIGTYEGLDGEMLLLDGTFYQVKADGKIYNPPDTDKTPFASVVRFKANSKFELDSPLSFAELCARIDKTASNKNLFVAIHIKGRFAGMKTRSVPKQQKPYPPLVKVTAKQPEFELGAVDGEIVGFRLPSYVKGINVPGYHLHFISADRKSGGHILGFSMESGTVELDKISRFQMILPEKVADFGGADLSKDRSRELEKAEK